VVNPPAAEKYHHWTNAKLPDDPEAWLADAKQQPGSWWPEWARWVAKHGGGKVAARQPGDGKLPPIEHAPGSYVAGRLQSPGRPAGSPEAGGSPISLPAADRRPRARHSAAPNR